MSPISQGLNNIEKLKVIGALEYKSKLLFSEFTFITNYAVEFVGPENINSF